ncbi:histidine-type phosphatase [Agromyces sp. PvR057]|uniref:histidine-type phosphatase n=1 Tax=Agromyces sp. PvR057 TaxID=3156403 RepID=UPI00339681F4
MFRPLPTRRRLRGAHAARLAFAAGALGALAAAALAGPAVAAETSDAPVPTGFYSSKQPYLAPAPADLAAYSPAPAGYTTIATESVARHGSRGLSGYKYDALLHRLSETAVAEGGFLTPEIGTTFIANLDAITAANVENGYGMLTGQGATQHQGIGARAYERNAPLFEQAAAAGDRIVAETSGEARATESGENFLLGFADAAAAAGATAPSPDAPLVAHPERLYFHKVENPDGTDKAEGSPEREIAEAYEAYLDEQTDDGGTIAAATDFIEDLPRSVEVADELLSGIFTPAFIAQIGADDAHTWFNTADGTETGPATCAPGADPAADPDACGDPEKSIESPVDAAMTLYNLYIIAVDMQEENVAPHEFDFDPYFVGHEADAEWFAYLLDAEDFYEKGPSLAGHDETFRIAKPLLDDFFATIDARAAGGDVAATFRFAHAETIIPFAALLRLPGSTVAAPDVASPASAADVYDYAGNPWRGAQVTPMAANVQWDVVARKGVDPATGSAYTPLVRMLSNEREIAFAEGCAPVAEGSSWVKTTELRRCLADVATTESPLIADDAAVASDASAPAGPRLAETGAETGAATAAMLLLAAGVAASVVARRVRRAQRG